MMEINQRQYFLVTDLHQVVHGKSKCRLITGAYGELYFFFTEVLDFAKLTLHQAKRLEMESQVKVLELESSLDKERRGLAALRPPHYQLAGESAP